jgi:hypothetical protein
MISTHCVSRHINEKEKEHVTEVFARKENLPILAARAILYAAQYGLHWEWRTDIEGLDANVLIFALPDNTSYNDVVKTNMVTFQLGLIQKYDLDPRAGMDGDRMIICVPFAKE